MNWLKAATIGVIGSLVMYVLVQGVLALGLAPFNLPPAAAFLKSVGLPQPALGAFVHFAYGALMGMVFLSLFGEQTDAWRGLGFAVVLWLVMMIIYSPVMGWGLFGYDAAAHELPRDHPLHLAPGLAWPATSLVLHAVWGLSVGWLCSHWLGRAPVEEPRRLRPVHDHYRHV